MNTFLEKLKLVFKDPVLRNRVFFTIGALIIFRLLAIIPIPGIDPLQLKNLFANNQFLGLLDIFSGGGLSTFSIMMLGVGPFITATIIMQLLTMVFPKLKALYQEEGEAGRMKFAQYSRLLTIPLSIIQGYSFMILLERQQVVTNIGSFSMLINIVIITAASLLLMWIGELITEFGIGNGVSLLIFAGIVSRIPAVTSQLAFTFDVSQIPLYLGFLVAALLIVLGVVVVTEAERPIPVTYARRVRGMKVYGGVSTYLPLRLNQAGVIPIIFALSILLFPQVIVNLLSGFDNVIVQAISGALLSLLSNLWLYSSVYFVLVVVFTYFYTAVTFDPHTLSTNLQKNGAFIPGVRPGQSTADYISRILTRITLVGALFLGLVAILPLAMRAITGIAALTIGGTALLIVVSVVLDLMKKIDAQISMREY
ncbi:MAG: preprotein translocase subunit SecY [Candidatus Taylorbacteria bacterium RIFCSPHIGHO2_02_FULL_46_13]|uniref:Protein translocase subunit SecY n=1 Tax=Candidatus Taylorbacteria bacterium RIFCSPHIGHO2_02_FULL_46_13 TaxID=1802312 RepID=A0A1G2MRW9_9BACT|nr:MAG: preprotein translocase subunit SecY [Candidatus Taylorbacteria bacterium RIFCSPHIGHO2_02_FULL_46_13]